MTSHAAISRMRCTNLLAQVSADNIAAVEAVLAVIVAGQVRQNDSDECDGPASSPPDGEDRTAPNTLADRDCDGTSATILNRCALGCPHCFGFTDDHEPYCKLQRATDATSSGRVTGPQTSGTSDAKTSRDNATVAVSEASPEGRSAGNRLKYGDRVNRRGVGGTVLFVGDSHGLCYLVRWDDGSSAWEDSEPLYRAAKCQECWHVVVNGKCRCTRKATGAEILALAAAQGFAHEDFASVRAGAADDFDLDAATAEATCEALRAVTAEPVEEWQPVPGEQVEVQESVGSRTGPRVAIGTFVRMEDDVRGDGYGQWRVVRVHGVERRFRKVDVRRAG